MHMLAQATRLLQEQGLYLPPRHFGTMSRTGRSFHAMRASSDHEAAHGKDASPPAVSLTIKFVRA